jgi:hypothetical protein
METNDLNPELLELARQRTGQFGASMAELEPLYNAPRRWFELGRAYAELDRVAGEGDAMTPAQALAMARERAAEATKELIGPPRIGGLKLPQPGQQRRDDQGRVCEVQRCKVAATPGDEPLVEYLYEALEEHGGGVGEALMPLSQWEGLDPS